MNKLEMKCSAVIENEAVIRNAVGCFASTVNCTLEDIIDIKTIVSEAISNAIIHGYEQNKEKEVYLSAELDGQEIVLTIQDFGKGIANVDEATKMNFSSKDRSGLGFSIMKTLSDEFEIKSKKDVGTKLIIKKILSIKEN